MATVTRLPGLRHYRGVTTAHVVHTVRGRECRQGTGLAFWYRPATSALSEIPTENLQLPFLCHARTADFQDVTLQGTLTYRFADPGRAVRRLDFAVDPDTGAASTTGADQVRDLLAQIVTGRAGDLVADLPLDRALRAGPAALRQALAAELEGHPRLTDTGVEVLDVRIVSVRPEADVERALATPVREQIRAEADRAGYERRALAVEHERAIAENELANRIELETRREQLLITEGANSRRDAEQQAATAAVAARAEAERVLTRARAEAESTRALGAARADAEAGRLAACREAGHDVLVALALTEAASHLPAVQALTVTPDLVTGFLGALMRPGGPEAAPGGPVREAHEAPRPGARATGGEASGGAAAGSRAAGGAGGDAVGGKERP